MSDHSIPSDLYLLDPVGGTGSEVRAALCTAAGWLVFAVDPAGCLTDVGFPQAEAPSGRAAWTAGVGQTGALLPERAVHAAERAAGALAAYFRGERTALDLPVNLERLPAFRRTVLEAARRIGWGEVCTYGELAASVGSPRAARAVGQALAANPVPIVIPCHRVIGTSGSLTGFGGGLAWKARLLRLEGVSIRG